MKAYHLVPHFPYKVIVGNESIPFSATIDVNLLHVLAVLPICYFFASKINPIAMFFESSIESHIKHPPLLK